MHRGHCLPLIGPRTVALDCDIKSKINGNNHWLDDRSHQCWGELPRSQLLESPSHQPRTGTLQARLRQRTFLFNPGLIIAWPLSILPHIVDNFQELVDSWDWALVTHIGFNMQLYILYILFIGPESDHCLLLSLTDKLTNSLTPV